MVGAVASLASVALAAPSTSNQCLCKDSAQYVVNGFGSLLSAYSNETAEALLADDFTDTSDSINWLAGCKLHLYHVMHTSINHLRSPWQHHLP